jgi:hypothetical protein
MNKTVYIVYVVIVVLVGTAVLQAFDRDDPRSTSTSYGGSRSGWSSGAPRSK